MGSYKGIYYFWNSLRGKWCALDSVCIVCECTTLRGLKCSITHYLKGVDND